MGAGGLRVLTGRGVIAFGTAALAALAAGCGHASSSQALASGQAPSPAAPTMTPSAVPVLGQLTFGPFPSTTDGTSALGLCEDWAGLRAQYVERVGEQAPRQLEVWFSSAAWQPAFSANRPLWTDPAYGQLNTAFGLATMGQTASIANARLLDRACAAAD
jgi:hypothetical protein